MAKEYTVNNIVRVRFGVDRSWRKALDATQRGFTEIGEQCGDDQELMKLKAASFVRLLKKISQGVTAALEPKLPADLTVEQRRMVEQALVEAVRAGVVATIDRDLKELTIAGTDLCTSCLARRSTFDSN